MSDTPRTDNLKFGSGFTYAHRAEELCKQLERELAALAAERLADAKRHQQDAMEIAALSEQLAEARRDATQARAEIDRLERSHSEQMDTAKAGK